MLKINLFSFEEMFLSQTLIMLFALDLEHNLGWLVSDTPTLIWIPLSIFMWFKFIISVYLAEKYHAEPNLFTSHATQ